MPAWQINGQHTTAAIKRMEHPAHLLDGKKYLLSIVRSKGCKTIQEIVCFAGFTPCPATVVVLDTLNRRLVIQRCSLYKIPAQ
jgi:hypothetical protein